MNYLGIDWGRLGVLQVSDAENLDLDFVLSFWTGDFYHFKQRENISTSRKFKEIIKRPSTDKILILIDEYSDYFDVEVKLAKKASCEFVVVRPTRFNRSISQRNRQDFIVKLCTTIVDGFFVFLASVYDEDLVCTTQEQKVSIDLLKMNLLFPN